jgi:outer membrane protein TolC
MAVGLCATCTGPLWAQDIAPLSPSGGFFLKDYRAAPVPPSRLVNSSRLAALVSGNRLYLTAQDAVAIALENNIDIESSRYNGVIAEWNLTRQQAGGPLPGVPSGASQVGSVANGQGVSGSEAAAGISSSGGSSSSSSAVNATISQIGSTTPTLDPVVSDVQSYSHLSTPQFQQSLSQTINLIQKERSYSEGISQGLITGGTVSLTYSDSYLNENSPTDVLNPASSASLSISLQHALLQGFGRALNSRNITIAKANVTISDLSFKQEVISVVVSVLNGYYALSADFEDVKAKRSALIVANHFYEDNKKQVEIGTLAPLDVTTAEAQVASSDEALVVSETTLQQDQLQLKNLLSRNGLADPILARVDIIPLDHITVPEKDDLPPMKELVASAMANRADLASDKLNLANNVTSALNTTNAVLPSLYVLANASDAGTSGVGRFVPLSGFGAGSSTTPGLVACPASVAPKGSVCDVANPAFVGGIGTALGQIFDRHFPSESAGFYFGAPLRDRASLADAAIDQLSLRQQALENARTVNQVLVDVSNQMVALQQARIRYQASVKNRILEEQLLTAEQKKFSLGASTTYAVVQQERDLATAQSTEVAALVAYSKARVGLDQTVGTTLTSNQVSIDEVKQAKVGRPSVLPTSLPPISQ